MICFLKKTIGASRLSEIQVYNLVCTRPLPQCRPDWCDTEWACRALPANGLVVVRVGVGLRVRLKLHVLQRHLLLHTRPCNGATQNSLTHVGNGKRSLTLVNISVTVESSITEMANIKALAGTGGTGGTGMLLHLISTPVLDLLMKIDYGRTV